MNKRGKMLVVVLGIMIQLVISVLYGFGEAPVSASGCFIIWCVCAVVINRFMEMPDAI